MGELIGQFAQPPIEVLHITVRLRPISFCYIASDLQLTDVEVIAGPLDGEDDIILHFCLKLIDIDSLMIEAALFPDDGALLGQQVVHNKVLGRVVDDFLIIECEGH